MAFLKILFWILFIVLVLVLLVVAMIMLALSVKFQIGFVYEADKKKFWLKYGIIPIKIYPEMFTDKKKEKRSKLMNKLRYYLGPTVSRITNKAKDVASQKMQDTKEKKEAEKDLNDAIFFEEEEKRIESEMERLSVELPKSEEEYEKAAFAEKEGRPFPEVVKEEEVSKLDDIITSLKAMDIPGAIDSVKAFMSGFSFDSIVALLSRMGGAVGGALGKVLRKLIIKQLRIGLIVSGDDAAKTALKYGRIAAVAYPALGKMASSMTVKDLALDMTPDYLANKDSAELSLVVAFRPLMLLTPFITMMPKLMTGIFKFMGDYKKTKKENQKQAKAEQVKT